MRTTIELDDAHRAKLLELAARRGEKGFSRIISDALDVFWKSRRSSNGVRRELLKLRGSLSRKDADALRAATSDIRRSWR
jgi:hypothetical protein